MTQETECIRARLFALQDEGYRAFHSRLMPTVPPETVIGVRVPALRRLAKRLAGTPQAEAFLQELPHIYYEENNLHAFLLESIRDYDAALAATEKFLPYIDNWATCDSFCPKVFAKHKEDLLPVLRRWMASDHPYTVRYGDADAVLSGRGLPPGTPGLGGGGAQRGILHQYDAGLVLCHGAGQTAGSSAALADRAAAGRLDPQQDDPKGRGKLPHPGGNQGVSAYPAGAFIKASQFAERLPVYFTRILL